MFQFWCFKWNSEGEATPDQIAPGYPRLSDWNNSNWNDNRKRSIKEYFSSCLSLPIYSFDDYFNGESKWGFRWEFQMKKSEYKSHRGDLVAVCDGSVILNFGEKKIKIFVIKCVSSPFDDLTRWVCVIQVRHLLQELLFFFFSFYCGGGKQSAAENVTLHLGQKHAAFSRVIVLWSKWHGRKWTRGK